MYTIGQVSNKFNLSISTLRYYDKEGLLQDVQRNEAGIRKFSQKDLNTLHVIECLKKSGMQLKDIKIFLDWCKQGDSTLEKRYEMILRRKAEVQKQMEELQNVMDFVDYKCWYYQQAVNDGTEEYVKNINAETAPEEIRELYKKNHI